MKLLFVDLDGTITSPEINNTFDFIQSFYKRYNIGLHYYIKMVALVILSLIVVVIPIRILKIKIRRFQIIMMFKGLDANQLKDFTETYWINIVYNNLNKEVMKIINYYRKRKFKIIMLTACTEIPAKIIAKKLKFNDVISTDFIIDNDNKIVGIKNDTFGNLKINEITKRYSMAEIREAYYITDNPKDESELLSMFKRVYIVMDKSVITNFGGVILS